MKKLLIFINNDVVFEFDRALLLEDEQLAFLEQMDTDMESGIKIYGELIENPDDQQRATFIALNLIKALQQSNDAVIFASCAYLVNRFPELIEVHAKDHEDVVKIELIEE